MKKVILRTAEDKGGRPISPLLFGSFIEHIENCIAGGIVDPGSDLSDGSGLRLDVLEKCRELGPTILRFPGGTVMGIYHWEDHVGPLAERKKKRNIVWGGMLTHAFGTCEFIEYCRKLGAEPMICVNMPTGSAEEAANWVEYCNGTEDTYYANLRRAHGYEEPFNVRYWCIGNESYAEPDLGVQHDVNTYIREAWEYTKYMKMTDPSIELVYVGYDEAWNKAVLDALGPVADYLSVHFYAGGEDPFTQTKAFEEETLKSVEMQIAACNAEEKPLQRWYRIPPKAHPTKLALDEWNLWNPDADNDSRYGLQQKYCWKDALWTGTFINMLIRHCDSIGIANLAQMVNVIAPITAEKEGSWKQTTFHVFRAMRNACGSVYLPSETEDDLVDAVVTADTQGRRTVMAVNRGAEAAALELPWKVKHATVLTSDSMTEPNSLHTEHVTETVTEPDSASSILPPQSVCILSEA